MTDHSLPRIAAGLFFNGLIYRYKKMTGKPMRPQAISLEITHRCIAKCIMCNIWQIPEQVPELSADEWLDFLSDDFLSDIRELDITGGEPFLLDDIDRIFSGIAALSKKNLKKLKSAAVTTNGFLTERVVEKTEKILSEFNKAGLDLVVVCALDGIGEVHEKIRNVKEAFNRVSSTIDKLSDLRSRYSNLVIGIKTTILPVNIDELQKISKYACAKGLFTIMSPCIITSGRYLNKESQERLQFSYEDKAKMIRFFKGREFMWGFHTKSLIKYLETGVMRKPCTCGFNYFFIRSSGELYLCPLINKGLGSIKNKKIKTLLFSDEAVKFRKMAGNFPECIRCTEPGLERYALPFEGFTYLRTILKSRQRFK
ncbi:MAG: radical SAM protein, partial [Deltaproteobacteria bacterium]|nr:radical SAM protein [Deltaproteobacteria bacterium]